MRISPPGEAQLAVQCGEDGKTSVLILSLARLSPIRSYQLSHSRTRIQSDSGRISRNWTLFTVASSRKCIRGDIAANMCLGSEVKRSPKSMSYEYVLSFSIRHPTTRQRFAVLFHRLGSSMNYGTHSIDAVLPLWGLVRAR